MGEADIEGEGRMGEGRLIRDGAERGEAKERGEKDGSKGRKMPPPTISCRSPLV